MAFRIETERLLVRPWEVADRPAFERFAADAEMMRYINGGRGWDTARIDGWLARQARNLAQHGCCMGAAVLKQSGAVSGVGGIQPLENSGLFEIGWWIWKDYWNRGLATEMARGFVAHAFNIMQLPQIVALVDPPNGASIRVAEKLGMHRQGIRNAHELAERYPEIEVLYFTLARNPAV
ncbi:MAG: GNAT family N-acetyltransferase [Gammaproteobacteria bacterium]|nr:GNAT family N-acetyltransferase [Gammaproteobacteria bacterium]MDE1886506.1 GNAT family N-acetyltransferase [Gammaproteobacteria bacterium]MDE2023620.1 GNAT family N-acetyltransferase [Gammaproteobacteria bacterium]